MPLMRNTGCPCAAFPTSDGEHPPNFIVLLIALGKTSSEAWQVWQWKGRQRAENAAVSKGTGATDRRAAATDGRPRRTDERDGRTGTTDGTTVLWWGGRGVPMKLKCGVGKGGERGVTGLAAPGGEAHADR